MHWLPLLALLVAAPVLAQPVASTPDGAPCTYSDCALRIEQGYWSTRIVRGPVAAPERVGRLGVFSGDLADAVAASPDALAYADASRSYVRNGFLMILAGSVMYAVALSPNTDIPDNTRLGLLVGGVGLGLGSGLMITAGQRAQSRAIWEYNRSFAE